MTKVLVLWLIAMMTGATPVAGQVAANIWRPVAEAIDPGTEISLRLREGPRLRATLIGVRDDGVLVQPRTRVPVAVQLVPYDAIVSLERRQGGMSGVKAAAIGAAAGAGAFFGLMAIVWALVGAD